MTNNNLSVTNWAKKTVWYQIFPERFRNGDPHNDPTMKDICGAYPHDVTLPWQIHPWTSDWYELRPYEQKNGRDLWFNIQRRRYGGDLQGILDKLDYLQSLGINGIYLTPVFQSPSSHKYDGATYHHIDPNFGPDPAGDLKLMASEIGHDPSTWKWTAADKLMLLLIAELHQRGMHLIFDGVFNHVGINHWAFQDVVKNQQRSVYKDWFKILSWQNPKTGEDFKYSGWWSVKELPELRQDENGIVAGPREYIFAITRRWMDPDGDGDPRDGIDGWRLDVAAGIRHDFWKQWRELVKGINPEAYLTAEIISNPEVLQPYLQGDEFDAVMNYNFASICTQYFINERNKIPTSVFAQRLRDLHEAIDPQVAYVMQNLLDSHDTCRVGSRIVNRDKTEFQQWGEYYNWSKANNLAYETRKPSANECRIQKLLAIFQMTYVGAPMIYYGDEAGMWGANDPCCRKPMVWEDMSYEDEVYLPSGKRRKESDKVEFNRDLFEHYRKLIHIRNAYSALQLGNYQTLLADDERDLLTYSRAYQNQNIIVIINNSWRDQRAKYTVSGDGEFADLLEEHCAIAANDGQIDANVNAKSGRILVRQ